VPEIGGALKAWENFYVIVGSAAAALTGLQFVVMALVADLRRRNTSMREIDAFGTPNIVHFSAVLLISAITSAPWPSLSLVATALGVSAAAGVVYVIIVTRRARRTSYQPVAEDWIWHVMLPFVAYAALLTASLALIRELVAALFVIAGAALLLLFVGIHNAWDTVTFIVVDAAHRSSKSE
jgi:hypothetical protein